MALTGQKGSRVMGLRVIEVSEDLSDPDAPVFEEAVTTEIIGKEWFWTHIASPRREISRKPHGPFPSEEAALADASLRLQGGLQP